MDFSQEFRRAISQNSPLERFISLIERTTSCDYILQEEVPESPVYLALMSDRLDVVKLLVQNGASIEPLEIYKKSENTYPEFDDFGFEDDEDRFTSDPLITAAARGKQEVFNFLAPLASISHRRKATLHLAEGIQHHSISSSDDEATFQRTVNARPSSGNQDDIGQWLTDLAKVTIFEQDPIDTISSLSVQFLERCQSQISQGLDINTLLDNGCTFLWTAAHNGYVKATSSLIELGASVDIPNKTDGWTPLMIAVDAHIPWTFGTKTVFGESKSRQVEIVNLLLQAGANIHHQGMKGESALLLASDFEQDKGFDEELIDIAINEMEMTLGSVAN
ncbi:hypothetical protein HRE53_29370 (plasmid) [Acaryochloris sp. 'Moss Beach']|uniref:ankyrin repeat domain-containing protein n=1 Tax=Acaryochloris TaxID=155977 RepID=UPI001BAE68B7|nr:MULTISPECIES: ankyrin repeat domain-containing protein [Acaryochloris]QUY45802.1 hypothetical protein I1H34_29090 [Acaryochloris marina S15]UJB72871.1 hypothetical protein HRE53_29370 [Acaryochloris sp. 'Moss Beach']